MYTAFERFTDDELINRVLNEPLENSPMAYELARRLDTLLHQRRYSTMEEPIHDS